MKANPSVPRVAPAHVLPASQPRPRPSQPSTQPVPLRGLTASPSPKQRAGGGPRSAGDRAPGQRAGCPQGQARQQGGDGDAAPGNTDGLCPPGEGGRAGKTTGCPSVPTQPGLQAHGAQPAQPCDAHGDCGAHGLCQRRDRDGDRDKTRGRVRAWRHRGRAERLEGDAALTAGVCSSCPARQNKGCAAQPAWQKPSGGPRCTGSPQHRRVAFSSSPPNHDPGPCAALGLAGRWLQPWGEAVPSCIAAVGEQRGGEEIKENKKKEKRGEERVRGERKREREGGEWRAGTDPAPRPGPGGTRGVEPPPRLPPTSFRFPIKS